MTQADPNGELPIFYDQSGRRWKWTKFVTAFLIGCLVGFGLWITPQVLINRPVVQFQDHTLTSQLTTTPFHNTPPPSVDELALRLSRNNVPVIGEGSLVRVIAVRQIGGQLVGLDPFAGRIVSNLTASDADYLAGDTYALQRFGNIPDKKRVILTFDDGPHPTYTPQLLDLLSRESVPASFFVTGDNVVRYPEIARRIVREGHIIGNHTFTHINFDFAGRWAGEQEIIQTSRVIVAATGHTTSYFRTPYGGDSDQSLRNSLTGILTAQKLGFTNTFYDFDSDDWRFTSGGTPQFPTFDGSDKVILVHDGGGDRSRTIAYIEQLIKRARQSGYSFATLATLYPQTPSLNAPEAATLADNTSLFAAWAFVRLPHELITYLFFISLTSILFVTTLNIILAIIHHRRFRSFRRPRHYRPLVTIVVPAYNEGAVLIPTVKALINSTYKRTEIIIVDDGSTDSTWIIARKLAERYAKVRAIHQTNGGKSSAINRAVRSARGSIIISVDADTIFPPHTVNRLIRHFKDPTVGAVAGVVKVGNVSGLLTLWQALEYTISISIERNAHALLGAITVVPGACGAWRKSAIIAAGGLSHGTLAEDCDLTLSVQRLGRYRILQDNTAVGFTEAPQKLGSLIKQRFRWTFGSIQALWKHRSMLLNDRYRFLGAFVMPYAVMSIMIPLLFWPLLWFVALQNILVGNASVILLYFAITLCFQFILAGVGLLLARAPFYYLIAVPFARFIYGPIRIYVMYKTVVIALRGTYVGWNKLTRTGNVTYKQPRRAPQAAS